MDGDGPAVLVRVCEVGGWGVVKFVGFGWEYTRVKEATSGVVLGSLTA